MLMTDTVAAFNMPTSWARRMMSQRESLEAIRRGDMVRARDLLQAAAGSNPEDAGAHFGLAWVLKEAGDLDGALSHAQTAAALLEDDPVYWRLLSEIQQAKIQHVDRRLVSAQAALSQAKMKLTHDAQQNSDLGYRHELLGYARDYLSGFISVSDLLPSYITSATDEGARVAIIRDAYGQHADALKARGLLGEAALMRAIDKALQIDPYEAGLHFFTWIRQGHPTSSLGVINVGDDFLGRPRAAAAGHCLTLILDSDPIGNEDARANAVLQLVNTCSRLHPLLAAGTANRLLAIAEGALMALSRYYAIVGDPGKIMGVVDNVLHLIGWTSGGRTFHLRTVKHCLELVSRGEPVPPHLRKFVCEDDGGYLIKRFCEHPFTRFDMMHAADGSLPVQVCCSHWLPTVIGDIRDGAETVLNSPVIQDIRRSMLDGSFKYCDHLTCQTMCNNALPKKADIKDPELRHAIDTADVIVSRTRDILFGIDETCNLSCPSCRMKVYAAPKTRQSLLLDVVEKTVLPLLSRADSIMINPAGELFASVPARRVLEYISNETCPDLRIRIISNGTRFSEEEWNKFPGIHDKIDYVRISLDGATKETFEKLRRGAYYDGTWRNLAFLARLRRDGVIPALYFSYTYQLDNFAEMPAFVQMAIDHGVDGVLFERLMNMGAFTIQEYEERAVHMLTHPRYQEFAEVLKQPIMRRSIVKGDLAWLRNAVLAGEGEGEHRNSAEVWSVDGLVGSGEGSAERVTLTKVAGPGPQGQAEVDLMTEDEARGIHRIEFCIDGITSERIHTPNAWVKAHGRNDLLLEMRDGDSVKYGVAVFDLRTGAVRDVRGDALDAGLVPEKDGWFRVWAAMPFDRSRAVFNLALVNEKGTHVYAGDGGSGVLLSRVELVQGMPEGVSANTNKRADGTVFWSVDEAIGSEAGMAEGVNITRNTGPGQRACTVMVENGETALHRISFEVNNAVPGEVHAIAILAKAGSRGALRLEMLDAPPTIRYGVACFDLTAGTVTGTQGDVVNAGVIAQEDGWMRIWAAMPFDRKKIFFNIGLMDASGLHLYEGNGEGHAFIGCIDITKGAHPA